MSLLRHWWLAAACLLGAQAMAEPVLVELRTAAPTVLVAVVLGNAQDEDGSTTVPDVLDLDPQKWTVNGVAPTAIHRYSLPFEEQRSNFSARPFPVTVQHRIYLELPQALQEGAAYAVASPYGSLNMAFASDTAYCESIKVNQVGYSARATSRYANYGVFMGDGGSIRFAALPAYQVVREADGLVVAGGNARYMADDTYTGQPDDPNLRRVVSGEHVYRLSLNGVPAGGLYYVKVPGCGRSRAFGVGDAYLREAAYVITRGLYHQRCGAALEHAYTDFTRAVCHTQIADTRTRPDTDEGVPVPPALPVRPMSGGHHDAGNFQRLPEHQLLPILLMGYFEAFPANFVDSQYRLPESGNGIPDILDEALWAVRSWENLQIEDPADPEYGGVMAGTVEQPAGQRYFYGWGSAANNPQLEGTWPVQENTSATAAGMFAHASRLLRPFDAARAEALLARARRAWAYLKRSTDVTQGKAHFMYAAAQLYLATGETEFHDLFKASARTVVIDMPPNTFPEVYAPGNSTSTGQTAHFIGYLLPGGPTRDAATVAGLRFRVFDYADRSTYMGPMPESDPYPQGVTKFLGWGTGTAQGRYADVYAFAWRLSDDPARKQLYLNAVSQLADFSLGLNPFGMSFYTGLGWDQPTSPLHLDSYHTKYGTSDGITTEHLNKAIGNVPGFLIMGPASGASGQTYQAAVWKKMVPSYEPGLPMLRRFAQGWSLINSNEGGVGSMMWNVAMLGFLHDSGNSAGAMCTSEKPLIESSVQACPNGLVGAVTSKRDHICVAGNWTPTPWQAMENTCAKACTGTQPADETRTSSCPAGQYGAIAEKRSYACAAGNWTAGPWIATVNACSSTPPADPVCTVDRLANTVSLTGLSALACAKRDDTGAIAIPANQAVSFTGAPARPVDVLLYNGINTDGTCRSYARTARCVEPVAAKPVCQVSPWDGSLHVTGLGTEIACVKRDATGAQAKTVYGQLGFPAPAQAGETVSTFAGADAAGNCSAAIGQLSCSAVAKPVPVCTVQPNGALLFTGLGDSLVCLSRTDATETQFPVDGRAVFTAAPNTAATWIYAFTRINTGGACVDHVSSLRCTAPPAACGDSAPPDDTRVMACQAGEEGLMRLKRTYACAGDKWVAGDWTFQSSTCAPVAAGTPTCEIDPASDSVKIAGLGQEACVKRMDTNAVALASGRRATFAGAPLKDFEVRTYNTVAADGGCAGFVRMARCIAPAPATPQCLVSPWDGSLQVSGLGVNTACVKRKDNGMHGLNDIGTGAVPNRGRVTFNGPVPGNTAVTLLRTVSQTGACGDAAGDLACAAVARPAPVCTIEADGSLLVRLLNASTPCLSRSDTGTQTFNVDGTARFSAPPMSPSMRVYVFSTINTYGACVGHVASLPCSPAP